MWVFLKEGRLSCFHHGAHWHVYCLQVSLSPCQGAARLNSKTDFSGGRDFYPWLIVKSMWPWVFGEMVYDAIRQVCCRSLDAGGFPATQPASVTLSSVFYLVHMRCFLLATSSSELPAKEGWQFCCLSHMEKQVAFVQRLFHSLCLLSYYWWPPCLNSVWVTLLLMNFPNSVHGWQLNVLLPVYKKCKLDCLPPHPQSCMFILLHLDSRKSQTSDTRVKPEGNGCPSWK